MRQPRGLEEVSCLHFVARRRSLGSRRIHLEAKQRRLLVTQHESAPEDNKAFAMIALVFGDRAGAILDLTAVWIGKMVDFRVPGAPQTR